jgi:transcriptional regulator with XRE-family HTH domain
MTSIAQRSGTLLSEQVAEEIRALLARRRISGRELARRLGASPSWVNFRLTGAQAIDLNDLQRIAEVLDVDVTSLIPNSRTRTVVNGAGTAGQTTVPTLEAPGRPHLNGHPKRSVPAASTRRPARKIPFIPELMTDDVMAELLDGAAA